MPLSIAIWLFVLVIAGIYTLFGWILYKNPIKPSKCNRRPHFTKIHTSK